MGDKQRDSVVDEIKQWSSVLKAAPLKADAKNPSVRRMYNAYVDDEADVEETVEQLSSLPEVESAEPPAERYLYP